ncbi:hypothetical protein As57867_013094, partial [Aphanomyces stellatus]
MQLQIDDQVEHVGKGADRVTSCKHCGGKMTSQSKDRWKMHMRQCAAAPLEVRHAYPTPKRKHFNLGDTEDTSLPTRKREMAIPFPMDDAAFTTNTIAPSNLPPRALHAGLSHPAMRAWTEPTLHASQLIYPLFITGRPDDNPIRGLEPNVQWGNRANFASLVAHLDALVAKGLRSVMLFGVVELKDGNGCMADDESTPVIACMKVLRKELPTLLVSCDVCMCEYTDHGHCGLLKTVEHDADPIIDNAATVVRLADIALAYAKAGAHMVCPSDMMDNRIGVIRAKLNDHGFAHVSIMAYTSKKASCMYAPFRDAVESTFKGDRKRYQHPVGSASHALLAYERDVAEGADSVIVKP